jgi:hypothetical protein
MSIFICSIEGRTEDQGKKQDETKVEVQEDKNKERITST